jgi:hypothetical protein
VKPKDYLDAWLEHLGKNLQKAARSHLNQMYSSFLSIFYLLCQRRRGNSNKSNTTEN